MNPESVVTYRVEYQTTPDAPWRQWTSVLYERMAVDVMQRVFEDRGVNGGAFPHGARVVSIDGAGNQEVTHNVTSPAAR